VRHLILNRRIPIAADALCRALVIAMSASAVLAVAMAPLRAANVTMTASDSPIGNSSFDAAAPNDAGYIVRWDNMAFPSSGNDYFTGNYVLRTPDNGANFSFAGDSLTVNNTNGFQNGGLWYKGSGSSGVITIDNLILDGGAITHQSGVGDVFQLDGNLNVASNSQIYAKQGPIDLSAVVSGSATITNPGSDGPGRTLIFSSPSNTFTGDIVNNGRFELGDGAVLNFVVAASGVNNSVSGTGAEAVFNGDFVLDLSSAGTTLGDSWSLVSAANASYGSTFTVPGFTQVADVWKSGIYQFSEATGVLSVAPKAGDVDNDGDVDEIDYQAILAHFQKHVTSREEGDLNGDGIVNLSDFAEWRLAHEALLASSSTLVPEPFFAVQALLALCGWTTFARRFKNRQP
jgi:Dockerin type I domain